jgi:hypothetical protein
MKKTLKTGLFHLRFMVFKKIYTMRKFVQKKHYLGGFAQNNQKWQINSNESSKRRICSHSNCLINIPKVWGWDLPQLIIRWCHGVIRIVIVLGKVAFYITSSIEYGVARLAIIFFSQFEQWMEAHSVASCIGNTSPHPTFIHA